jgi:hypothetical protein
MHTLVHITLALVAVSLILIAVLVLLLIQMIRMSVEDEAAERDAVGECESKPGPFGATQRIPDDLSAGGWPEPTLADRLPSPAGEPSADPHR